MDYSHFYGHIQAEINECFACRVGIAHHFFVVNSEIRLVRWSGRIECSGGVFPKRSLFRFYSGAAFYWLDKKRAKPFAQLLHHLHDKAERRGQTWPAAEISALLARIARHTIEEKIVALHKSKRDLADSLLDGADMSGKMTAEELLRLIRS